MGSPRFFQPDLLWAEVRYGWRQLLRSPGSSLITILVLAVGIGANAAIFTLSWTIVLSSLPVPHPERLVEYDMRKGDEVIGLSGPEFDVLRKRQQTSTDLMAWTDEKLEIRYNATPAKQDVQFLSDSAISVLQINPQIGRLFSGAGNPGDAAIPAVLGHKFWQSQFNGSAEAIGKVLIVGDHPVTIVGVMPQGFEGLTEKSDPAIYVPISFEILLHGPNFLTLPGKFNLFVLGRLRPGQDLGTARAELQAIQPTLRQLADPTGVYLNQFFREFQIVASDGHGGMSGLRVAYQRPLAVLETLAVSVLALCCINTALVILARVSSRRQEFAIRNALGSSRGRLVGQVLIETFLLILPGLIGGIFLGWLAAYLLLNLLDKDGTLSAMDLRPNLIIMGVNLFSAAIVALGAGLWPAIQASLSSPSAELKGGDHRSTSPRFSGWVISAQVAISLTMVTAAAVLGGSLSHLLTAHSGFRAENVAIATMDFGTTKLTSRQQIDLTDRFLRTVEGQPGVLSAGYIGDSPLSGSSGTSRMFSIDQEGKVHTETKVHDLQATQGYFATVGTQILSGEPRVSPESGTANCTINVSLANFFFPHEPPIGKLIYVSSWPQPDGTVLDTQSACRVTAIAEDAKFISLRESVPSMVYEVDSPNTARTFYEPSGILVARARTVDMAFSAVHNAASNTLPAELDLKSKSFNDQVNLDLSRERVLVSLSSVFAALALLLTGLGLYGVLMQSVISRTREIGLRVALGSGRTALFLTLLRPILLQIGVGLILGTVSTELVKRAVSQILQVSNSALSAQILAAGAILVTALIAATTPMHRAYQIDPIQQLKSN